MNITDPVTITKVLQLKDSGLSQRAISRALGINRGTVGKIIHGHLPRKFIAKQEIKDDEPIFPSGPPERCPGCGGLVYMPCILCRTRMATNRKPSIKTTKERG
jgi:hypothetical protein